MLDAAIVGAYTTLLYSSKLHAICYIYEKLRKVYIFRMTIIKRWSLNGGRGIDNEDFFYLPNKYSHL